MQRLFQFLRKIFIRQTLEPVSIPYKRHTQLRYYPGRTWHTHTPPSGPPKFEAELPKDHPLRVLKRSITKPIQLIEEKRPDKKPFTF